MKNIHVLQILNTGFEVSSVPGKKKEAYIEILA